MRRAGAADGALRRHACCLPCYALVSLLAKAPPGAFLAPTVRARLYHFTVVALNRVLDEVLSALLPAACACVAVSECERGDLREVARFVLRGPSLSSTASKRGLVLSSAACSVALLSYFRSHTALVLHVLARCSNDLHPSNIVPLVPVE